MNILFDFLTTHSINGAAEYVRRVFYTLLDEIDQDTNIHLFGLYNSLTDGCVYEDLSPENLKRLSVTPIDLKGKKIDRIVLDYGIDKIFIGCAQFWGRYPEVSNINCPVVCVIHDLAYDELSEANLDWYMRFGNFKELFRFVCQKIKNEKSTLQEERIINLIKRNKKCKVISVSNYTKLSIIRNFQLAIDQVEVLYSPERLCVKNKGIADPILKQLIDEKIPYYLMVSAHRLTKNGMRALSAFKAFVNYNKDIRIVTLGKVEKQFDQHIPLPLISESDLAYAYENCYALLYPSFFEGFGYPPLEAMKYSKPVLASNVTSIPEILGDSAFYFSPIYVTDMLKTLLDFSNSDYTENCQKAQLRYREISAKQSKDLDRLIQLILEY